MSTYHINCNKIHSYSSYQVHLPLGRPLHHPDQGLQVELGSERRHEVRLVAALALLRAAAVDVVERVGS